MRFILCVLSLGLNGRVSLKFFLNVGEEVIKVLVLIGVQGKWVSELLSLSHWLVVIKLHSLELLVKIFFNRALSQNGIFLGLVNLWTDVTKLTSSDVEILIWIEVEALGKHLRSIGISKSHGLSSIFEALCNHESDLSWPHHIICLIQIALVRH